ncbi:MAG: hypothetical protein ABIM99_06230 [Candidatus Dojkabacteria bacterium]
MNDLMSKANMKLGGTFGLVAAVLVLLSFIPCIGFVFSIVAGLVLLAGGYVVVMVKGGTKDQLSPVLKNSLIASIPAAVVYAIAAAVSSILSTLFFFPRIAYFDIGPSIADFLIGAAGGFIGGAIWVVIAFLIGSFVGVYVPETSLPSSIRDILNKFKAYATKA